MKKANVAVENNGSSKSFSKLVGVARLKFMGVNPDMKRKNELGYKDTEEPNYITEKDGRKSLRLEFYFQLNETLRMSGSDIPQIGAGQIVRATLFVSNNLTKESMAGKIQVIDKYGNSAYVTADEFNNKQIPADKNNRPMAIDSKYIKTFEGETQLIDFIRILAGFKKSTVWKEDERRFIMESDPTKLAECELFFESRKKFMDGDFNSIVKELKECLCETNVRGCLGVRQSGDKEYQDMIPVLDYINNYNNTNIKAYLARRKDNMTSWVIDYDDVHEYTQQRVVADEVKASDVKTDDLPF